MRRPFPFVSFLLAFGLFTAWAPSASACTLGTGGYEEACRTMGGTGQILLSPETWPGYYEFRCHHEVYAELGGYAGHGPFTPSCPIPPDPPAIHNGSHCSTNAAGSIINVGERSVAEIVPIIGAPFYLRYDSGKVRGFKTPYMYSKQITSSYVPSGLTSITVATDVAGRTLTDNYTSFTTDMRQTTVWDGLDNMSNPVEGSVEITIRESATSTAFHPDDHLVPKTNLSPGGDGALFLGQEVAERLQLGGWTISIVHIYDKVRNRVNFGSGGTSQLGAELVSGDNIYRAVSPDGSEVYIFNLDGLHTHTLNALTGSTKYTISYGGSGAIQSITDAYSKTTTISRDGSLNPTKITASYSQETLLETDLNGYISKITAPDSTFHEMTYDATGLLATFEKPSGLVSTFTYNSMGQLLTDSGSDGFDSTLSGNSSTFGTNVSQLDTAEGNQTFHISYNQSGYDSSQISRSYSIWDVEHLATSLNESAVSRPNGHARSTLWSDDPRFESGIARNSVSDSFSTAYGPAVSTSHNRSVTYTSGTGPFNIDTLTTTSTTNSKTFTETYDGTLNKLTYTSPLSRTQTVQLNSQERPISIQHADLTATSLTYNGNGQLTETTQGGRTTEFTYNADGWLSSVENAMGQTTSYTYDDNGRVLTTTLPDTRVITYTWNANGDLASVTPPSRPSHSFSFGSNDLPSVYTPPSIGGTVATNYLYDLDRRLKKITRPSTEEIEITYTNRKVTLIETSLGDYTFNYSGLVGGELYEGISPSGVTNTIYHFNSSDVVNGYQVSGNGYGRIGFAYDSFARISDINVLDAGGTPLHSASFTFDDDGLLTGAGDLTMTRHGSRGYITDIDLDTVEESLSYNSFGELTGKTVVEGMNTLYSFSLTRDLLGRVTQKVETVGGVATTYDYTYDTSGRLVDVNKNSAAYSEYVYNDNSNRTSRTVSSVTSNSTSDNQDRMLTHGTLTFSHNQNGERTQKSDSSTTPASVTDYTYDVVGNLTRVDLPSTDYIEYLYDAFDRRSVRKVNGTVHRYYVYQSDLQIAAEYDSGYALVARYIYASQSHVPDYVVKGGVNYRIVTDHLGSVRLVVRADTGAVVQAISYDEFGRVLSDTNPGFQAFGFAGGLYDSDTGLVRFGARDYDPETGRWLSKDPILFNGGDTNLYGYVLNDPVNLVDPNGLWAFQIGGAIGGLFPGLGGAAESGIAVSYSEECGLQFAGYQSAQGRAGVGIFGGLSLNFTFSPTAIGVHNLNGPSVGVGLDTMVFSASGQLGTSSERAIPSYTLGFGIGGLGAAYFTTTYTHVGPAFRIGGR